MLAALPLGVFEADRDGRLVAANDAFRELALGGGPLPIGAAPWANAHPGDRASAELAWQREREQGGPFEVAFRVWRQDGGVVWVGLRCSPVRAADGTLTGYLGTVTDDTEVVHDRQLNQRLEGLLEASPDAVLIIDRHGSPVFVNDAARVLLGIADDVEVVREPQARSFMQAVRDQLPREVMTSTGSATWQGEVGYRDPTGFLRTLSITMLVERAGDGTVDHWAGIARDVTAGKQLQDELVHQATHDGLTGLPNRTLFLRKLAEAIERSRTLKAPVAVLFLDLDNLKDVNDSIGHEVGDVLLSTVARRLVATTRPADVVGRIGGDEFVMLCEGVSDEHAAVDLGERVRHAVTGRMMLMGNEVFTSASVGVAIVTPGGMADENPAEAAVTLLRNADTAMYRAKTRGRARVEIFTDEMRTTARERVQLAAGLERALAGGELYLVYQPIVSAHTGRVAGAEALLRWNHPERGLLTPPSFVDLAEESGLIVPIGDWVVRQATLDTRAWLDAGIIDRTFVVHVNVSARQLADSIFVERVLSTLRELEIEASTLDLEFTERTMLDDNPGVLRSLHALKRFGVRLGIDDFGTGYSSLSYLRRFPADFLKLDGSFVRDLGSNGNDEPIVRSVIQLAHSLDMSVIAEWVTTDDQLHRLRMLGCDFVQGHRLGEPVPADDFGRLPRLRL